MIKNFACPVCFNNKFEFIENVTRVFAFSIYKCKTCSLYFQYPIPTKKKLKVLYNQIYSKKCNLPLAENAFEVRQSELDRKKLLQIQKYKKKGTLLDIGASTGFFIECVNSEKGWSADGIEYSADAVKKAKKDFHINLIHGEVTNAKIPKKNYDVITMFAVLDHIPDIQETFKAINKKIKKGGIIVLNIQNSSSWEYPLYKILHKSYPGFIFEHLYYFNKYNISILLKQYGFEVKKITSQQFSPLTLPPKRPLIGWLTFLPKLFLEYTSWGGGLQAGNTLTVYAQKI